MNYSWLSLSCFLLFGFDFVQNQQAPTRDLRLWRNPSGVVPYVILDESKFNQYELRMVKIAFQGFHETTCIRFIPRTTESKYIVIEKGAEGDNCQCNWFVNPIVITLPPWCLRGPDGPRHEFYHALGFEHEDMDHYNILNITRPELYDGLEPVVTKDVSEKIESSMTLELYEAVLLFNFRLQYRCYGNQALPF